MKHRTIVRAALALMTALTGSLLAAGTPAGAATLPTLTFSPAKAIASPQGGTITFTAALSAASATTVTVNYATKNGTAIAGIDYTAASGELQIPPGQTTGSVTVTLLPAKLGAGGSNKQFTLTLSGVTGATLAEPSVTGTIHPDVYVTGSLKAFADVVINPASTTAYFTVPDQNQVAVLNLATGTYSKPIPVGSDPNGIDITPDGTTLYVCDTGGQTISKVDLATRKVTTITTPPGTLDDTPYSIAVMNNDNALFSTTFDGSGYGADVYDLNLHTNAITEAIGPVTEVTELSRNADASTVGIVLGDDSGGPFDIYSTKTGNTIPGHIGNFISSSSVNGKGTKMLIDGTYVVDALSGALLGTISDAGGNSALASTGSTGYVLESNEILTVNISRFLAGKAISLPQAAAGGAQLALSANGQVLVAETGGGATIIEL